ncbi:MAG: M60 family metallopeptidase [Eisenbergiella massiliensis]
MEVAALKVGRNEITVPAIQSLAFEGGGALYIQYTGNDSSDRYAVRVSGGAREPVLNLYGISDEQERKKRITAYVEELEEQAASLEARHKELHQDAVEEGNKVNRKFDRQNCILGATDIMLNQMMYSVSGEQILKGLGKGSTEEKAERLDRSLQAMDQMLAYFYQHKGLSADSSAPATDRMPAQHLNIRYMMFAGRLCTRRKHVGIEWGSVAGLSNSEPIAADENGKYESGHLFGWGIAHEIGHNINQGAYAVAEITNNYFSLLASAKDTNESIRFSYDKVYDKVTSNTVGRSPDVFTQLALYWQLHLAYDRDTTINL